MNIDEFYFIRKKNKKKLTLRQDVFNVIYAIHILKQTPNSNTLIGHVLNNFFFNLSLIVRCEKVIKIYEGAMNIDEFYFIRKKNKKKLTLRQDVFNTI